MANSKFKSYAVWRSLNNSVTIGAMVKTNHTVKARTDEEARNKLIKLFRGGGFFNMSFQLVPFDE